MPKCAWQGTILALAVHGIEPYATGVPKDQGAVVQSQEYGYAAGEAYSAGSDIRGLRVARGRQLLAPFHGEPMSVCLQP